MRTIGMFMCAIAFTCTGCFTIEDESNDDRGPYGHTHDDWTSQADAGGYQYPCRRDAGDTRDAGYVWDAAYTSDSGYHQDSGHNDDVDAEVRADSGGEVPCPP